MSKQNHESRLPHGVSCRDTQMFNHIKGASSLTDPFILRKNLKAWESARKKNAMGMSVLGPFYPDSMILEAHSSKKHCHAFFNTLSYYQFNVSSASHGLVLWTEKRDVHGMGGGTPHVRMTRAEVMALIHKYSTEHKCPHMDAGQVLMFQHLPNVFSYQKGPAVMPCSLRAFLYVPTMRPFWPLLHTNMFTLQCTHKHDVLPFHTHLHLAPNASHNNGGFVIGAKSVEHVLKLDSLVDAVGEVLGEVLSIPRAKKVGVERVLYIVHLSLLCILSSSYLFFYFHRA